MRSGPGPCWEHPLYVEDCNGCILWKVEAHRILVEALGMADELAQKYDIPT